MMIYCFHQSSLFFFFSDTATTEIYTLSLHDALPIFLKDTRCASQISKAFWIQRKRFKKLDRKSTRLNSSHGYISYAVFCLKKKTYRSRACYNQLTLRSNLFISCQQHPPRLLLSHSPH